MKDDGVERAHELVAKGHFADAHALVMPRVDVRGEPGEAVFETLEVNYLALRTMDEEGSAELRDELERWLLRSPNRPTQRRVSTAQVLQTLGLSALKGGRPRRGLHAFARALREGKLSKSGRAMMVDCAADALSELRRHAAARSLALRELSRAPHEKLDWLFLRRAALSSSALGEASAAAEYARRCLEHPFFPVPLRTELDPLLAAG